MFRSDVSLPALRVRNSKLTLCPLATLNRACKRCDVVTRRLIEHVQTVPDSPIALLLPVRRDGQVRAAKAARWAAAITEHEGLVLAVCGVLALVGNVVALEATIGHLRIKVCRKAEGGGGVDAWDEALSGVLPRVDGMVFGGRRAGVGIFPIELHVVVPVRHHGVRGRAFAPAVAADTSVCVKASPGLNGHPYVLAVVPCILLESVLVHGVPYVHAKTFIKRLSVDVARNGWKLGVVGVAIVVALPAGLKTGTGRIHGLEIELAQWSGLPDIGCV